jgi:3-oxoacyl-[acyl-carrier protein] reductase
MNLGIKDRVAIVTGGSAGIGLAVVEELLENGANVCVVARKEARLLASVRRLQVTSERVLAIVADVADPLSAVSIVDQTINKFGHLDILVNNAGRAHAGGLMSSSEDDWEDMTAVKLTAMRMLCKAAIPAMRARQWGRIVNMSSIGGIYPDPKRLISHVLSAAINNITKSIALEVASDGILVNAIGIGAIATENWVALVIHERLQRLPCSWPQIAMASSPETPSKPPAARITSCNAPVLGQGRRTSSRMRQQSFNPCRNREGRQSL